MTPEADANFLEMDVDSDFSLRPILGATFPRAPLYLKTKSYCEQNAEAWCRMIKVGENVKLI